MAKSTVVRRRPEQNLTDFLHSEQGEDTTKSAPVRKSMVSIKAVEGEGDYRAGFVTPSDDQMNKINQYTLSPKEPEQVLVFPTMSCNDMYDRDDDGFRRGCIDAFHALEAPYSFVGKSFMADHDYTVDKARGRIFDEEVVSDGGITFLKHWVYMPNTPQYQGLAEQMDFGMHWAVSVGAVLGSTACSICDSPMVGHWFTYCVENGHEKGLYYDPKSDEKDEWGWAMPVDPNTKGAEKAMQDLFDPVDGYELSQVFLGAQYFAELAKKMPGFKGMVKAASARTIPIIGLSSKEAEALEMPHEPDRVTEARQKYTVLNDDFGRPTWVDDHSLKWVYDPDDDEVMSLGAVETGDNDEEEDDGSEAAGSVVRAVRDEDQGGDDGEGEGGLGPDEDGQPGGSDEGGADEHGRGAEGDEVDQKEKTVSKKAVLAAAKTAGVPYSLIEKINEAEGNGLDAVFSEVAATTKAMGDLTSKAELGQRLLDQKRADAVAWYVRAHGTSDGPVKTATFEKILDRFGDDVDLYDEVIAEQKAIAESRFPGTRRSAEPAPASEQEDHHVDTNAPSMGGRVIALHR